MILIKDFQTSIIIYTLQNRNVVSVVKLAIGPDMVANYAKES